MNTIELLTRLKAHYDGASSYAIAKKLDVKPQTVYHWESKRGTMSNEVGIRAAQLLGLDPAKVLLDLEIERNKGNATSLVWRSMRDRLEMAAAPAVVGLLGYAGGVIFGGPLI